MRDARRVVVGSEPSGPAPAVFIAGWGLSGPRDPRHAIEQALVGKPCPDGVVSDGAAARTCLAPTVGDASSLPGRLRRRVGGMGPSGGEPLGSGLRASRSEPARRAGAFPAGRHFAQRLGELRGPHHDLDPLHRRRQAMQVTIDRDLSEYVARRLETLELVQTLLISSVNLQVYAGGHHPDAALFGPVSGSTRWMRRKSSSASRSSSASGSTEGKANRLTAQCLRFSWTSSCAKRACCRDARSRGRRAARGRGLFALGARRTASRPGTAAFDLLSR